MIKRVPVVALHPLNKSVGRCSRLLDNHFSQLLLTDVAVEKLDFCKNGLKSGDRKCLPGLRKSLVGLPGAMNFL